MRAAPMSRHERYEHVAGLVRSYGPVTIGEISRFARLDVRYTTRLVNEMAAAGMLRRSGTVLRETVRGRKPQLFEAAQ